MIILFYFPKLQFENMIDCFAMFTSLLNISLAQLFSLVGLHKIEAFLADGFMKPPKRQAKISGHAVHYIYDCCEKTDLVEAFSAFLYFLHFVWKIPSYSHWSVKIHIFIYQMMQLVFPAFFYILHLLYIPYIPNGHIYINGQI